MVPRDSDWPTFPSMRLEPGVVVDDQDYSLMRSVRAGAAALAGRHHG